MLTKPFFALIFTVCFITVFTIVTAGALTTSHSYPEIILKIGGVGILSGIVASLAEPITAYL